MTDDLPPHTPEELAAAVLQLAADGDHEAAARLAAEAAE